MRSPGERSLLTLSKVIFKRGSGVTNIIDIIRGAITNSATPWVLYNNGTIVFMPDCSGDLASLASELLQREGPVLAGTPAGDFSVTSAEGGWFVRSHHSDILTVVSSEEMEEGSTDLHVGLLGRSKRDSDARELQVVHVYEGSESPQNTIRHSRSRLEAGDPTPMVDYLIGSDAYLTIEETDQGITVYPETRSAMHLEDPWGSMFVKALSRLPELAVRFSERGLEVRRSGALYYLLNQRLEDSLAEMLVTGIDHSGRLSGGTAQSVLSAFGPSTESAARELLTGTDRSLGTVVAAQPPSDERWIAYVVSTPKHTPESPGWLEKATRNILDKAVELGLKKVATTALGTNGGIEPEVAARLMLSTAEQWFKDHPVAMHFIFCLPHGPTRLAFETIFRRQRVYFSETSRF